MAHTKSKKTIDNKTYFIAIAVSTMILWFLMFVIYGSSDTVTGIVSVIILFLVWHLLLFMGAVLRLRAFGRHAAWAILSIVPLLGIVVFLYLSRDEKSLFKIKPINRQRYVLSVVGSTICFIVLFYNLGQLRAGSSGLYMLLILFIVYCMALVYLSAGRLVSIGKKTFIALVVAIPIIGFLAFLYLALKKGDDVPVTYYATKLFVVGQEQENKVSHPKQLSDETMKLLYNQKNKMRLTIQLSECENLMQN